MGENPKKQDEKVNRAQYEELVSECISANAHVDEVPNSFDKIKAYFKHSEPKSNYKAPVKRTPKVLDRLLLVAVLLNVLLLIASQYLETDRPPFKTADEFSIAIAQKYQADASRFTKADELIEAISQTRDSGSQAFQRKLKLYNQGEDAGNDQNVNSTDNFQAKCFVIKPSGIECVEY